MQSDDAAEKLLKLDDLATGLVVDSLMGFRRRKLSSLDLPPTTEEDKDIIKEILKSVQSKQDVARAIDQLLNCDWA